MGDLGAQRIVYGQPLADPLHGLVDVIDDGDDGRGGNIRSQLPGSFAEDAFGECQALQRDPGDDLRHRPGVVGRDVAAGDEGGVDVLATLALETETSTGQDRLAPDLVARQHDVVVEHPQYLHEPIVPRAIRLPGGERRRPMARGPAPGSAQVFGPLRPVSVLEAQHDGGRLDDGNRLLTLCQLELLDSRVGDGGGDDDAGSDLDLDDAVDGPLLNGDDSAGQLVACRDLHTSFLSSR